MSGHPNVEQINQLREALRKVQTEQTAIASAQQTIRHEEMVVSCAGQRLDKAQREVRQLLEAMDCGPNGNAGGEQRMLALLTGMVTMPERAR